MAIAMPAPKRRTKPKGMVGATLPPGSLALVDSLVGTFVGNTRSEVLRFIVASWLTQNITLVGQIGRRSDD